MANVDTLQKQIEYYMSDKNLENDEFFHNLIKESKEGFIPLDVLLNCNKIKKLGIKATEELAKAIEKSGELELHSERKVFRRKPEKALPDLRVKKVKVDTANQPAEKGKQQSQNPYKALQTVIFTLTTDKQVSVNFKFIVEALLRSFAIHPVYTRFNKTEGNFAINKKQYSEEIAEKMIKEGLKIGEDLFKIQKTEGKLLDEFNEKHRFHYNGIVDKLRKDFEVRLKEEKKNKKRAAQQVEFDFGGEHYSDINKLKSLFKNILSRAPNNSPLGKKEHSLLEELLQHHDKSAQKLKDIKHFVVDVHPEHKDTRCFFVIRQDGSKEDFSAVKCIENLEGKLVKA